jgi:tetratricopeptide (TPR) repeat protein
MADLAMRRKDFARAIDLLKKGLTLDADRSAFLVKLGEAHLELKQYDAAQSALQDAIKTKGDQAMAHFNLALVYEARGNDAAAIEAYTKEIAVSPKLHQPHFNLAKLHARAGRSAEAIAAFRGAVERNPSFGTGWLYLAKALLDAGELTGAEQAARRGLASQPDPSILPLGHYVLADVYSRQGRDADSKRQAAAGQRAERALASSK